MRVNYLILAHKNLNQLNRLVDKLLSNNGYVYVHLDRKWQLSENDILSFHKKRVEVLEDRFSCFLDDWSLIEATYALIKAALKCTPNNEKSYYYLLSGQDYPIKKPIELHQKLENDYPIPYIDCTPYHTSNWVDNKFRNPLFNKIITCKKTLPRKLGLLLLKIINPFIKSHNLSRKFKKLGIGMYGGSAWWCLPDIMIREILELFQDKELINLLMKVHTPEETIFQILSQRTSLASSIRLNPLNAVAQDCLTYANFSTPTKLPYKGHPHVITTEDYSYVTMKDQFFARKFDENIDSHILDMIDENILKI